MRQLIEYSVEIECEILTLTELSKTENIPRNILRTRYLRGIRGAKLIAPIEQRKKQKPRKPKEIIIISSPDDITPVQPQELKLVPRGSASRHDVVTYNGKTRTLYQWAGLTGIAYETIAQRYRKGFSVDALFNEVGGDWMKNKTIFTYNGVSGSLKDWAYKTNLPISTIWNRHKQYLAGNWTAEQVVNGKYSSDAEIERAQYKESVTKLRRYAGSKKPKIKKAKIPSTINTHAPHPDFVPTELVNLIKKLQAPKDYSDERDELSESVESNW